MGKKKKKDSKLASTSCQEANETNDFLRKEDQNQSGVGIAAGKNATVVSTSEDNAPTLNQQFQSVFQWSLKQSPLVSKPCIPSQSASPISQSQLNPTTHQVQQAQAPPHLVQSAMPVWLTQRPGYHLAGATVPPSHHPLAPMGTLDVNWQGPALIGGGMSARSQPQVPSFCYHAGYPYPGFPGPWDPSSWWGQPQQSLPPCTYTFPGACGNFSSPFLPASGCSAASAQSFQRGIIRPSPNISQNHQQLWEAQSAENIQLWTVVGHLQSELADCKSRLMKLEADTSSQKPVVEEPAVHATGTSLTGQRSKRGRQKRPIASVDVLPSLVETRCQARGRQTAVCNAQCETKDFNFEKGSISKVDDKEKASQFTTNIQQANDGKIATINTNNSSKIEISGSHPAFDNQINEDESGIQRCGHGEDAALGLENATVVGSPKDEDDEMADDDISGSEDTV